MWDVTKKLRVITLYDNTVLQRCPRSAVTRFFFILIDTIDVISSCTYHNPRRTEVSSTCIFIISTTTSVGVFSVLRARAWNTICGKHDDARRRSLSIVKTARGFGKIKRRPTGRDSVWFFSILTWKKKRKRPRSLFTTFDRGREKF